MPDENAAVSAPAPRRAIYAYLLWGLSGAAFVASVVAAFTTGPVRRAMVVAMMVAAAGMAFASSVRAIAPEPDPQLRPMGGAGYQRAVPGYMRVVNALVSLGYNVLLMVVVLAVLAVLAGLGPQVSQDLFQASPILVAFFLLLLAAALHWRIAAHGGILRVWYTRVHLGALMGYGLPLIVLGALTVPEVPVALGGWTLVETHLMVYLIIVTLGVGTQAFLTSELPTLFDLAQGVLRWSPRRSKDKQEAKATPPFVYAFLLAVGGTVVVWLIASQLDLGRRLGGLGSSTALYLVITFPLVLVMFFAASAFMVWRRGRRGLYRKRLSTRLRNDLMLYGVTGLAGALGAYALLQVTTGAWDSLGPFQAGKGLTMDLTMLTVVVTTGPIGWYLHKQNRRVDGIEDRLPDFLNDLAETRRAGLTMSASLQSVALSDYGPLTKEVRKMARQVAWGIPFAEALRQFAERVNTALVKRSAYLIIEAFNTGGSVAEILKAAARDAYELKSLEAERRTQMMTYVLVIYVVFFVFLMVLAILDTRFIPEVLAAAEAAEEAEASNPGRTAGSVIEGRPDTGVLRFIYFNATIVQAVGNGIVAGVLSESRLTAGLRHVAILSFSAWFVFRLLLGA